MTTRLMMYVTKHLFHEILCSILLVPPTEHHLSSFKCGFLNIFSRQNLLRSLSRLLFLLRWNKYGAKKCLKNTFYSTFEMIQLWSIREQENNRKAFEGASMEPIILSCSTHEVTIIVRLHRATIYYLINALSPINAPLKSENLVLKAI